MSTVQDSSPPSTDFLLIGLYVLVCMCVCMCFNTHLLSLHSARVKRNKYKSEMTSGYLGAFGLMMKKKSSSKYVALCCMPRNTEI